MANETPAPPAKGGGAKMTLILLAACGTLALAAGGAVPFFLLRGAAADEHKEDHHAGAVKQAYVSFGDAVVVNLNEDRLTRYLKVKILLVVEARDEKLVTELVQKKSKVLRNWLIVNLSDKALADVSGASGINKLRREIWNEVNHELFADGSEKVLDIFFEEFVVQ